MKQGWSLLLSLTLLLLSCSFTFAEDDPIYAQCMHQTHETPPWCYQIEAEKIGAPEFCENILKYWPRAEGVHGWGYYRLALNQKECRLDVCK